MWWVTAGGARCIIDPKAFFAVARRLQNTGLAAVEPSSHAKRSSKIMQSKRALITAAVSGVLAVGAIALANPAFAADAAAKEKCYGVAKAGKNDCQTANSSCAGTSKRDNQGDAWLYIPAGSCERIVGGSKDPKKA
jgi:uncharacterized membrane protein